MKEKEYINYIESKIEENEEYIRFTFYELRVKMNLTEKEVEQFLILAKNKFENTGYKIYYEGDEYKYKNQKKIVQENELMVAILETN